MKTLNTTTKVTSVKLLNDYELGGQYEFARLPDDGPLVLVSQDGYIVPLTSVAFCIRVERKA